jgi:hypothetical protein
MAFRLCPGLQPLTDLLCLRGVLLEWDALVRILHFLDQPLELLSVLVIDLQFLHFLLKPDVAKLANIE